jgi:hypothetical protein
MVVLAKQIAFIEGKPTYMGKPCLHGHDGKRYVRNNECCKCRIIQSSIRSRQKRQARGLKRSGRPRKYPELVGPPKPKKVVFKPVSASDRWIVRSKGSARKKLRKELSVEYYQSLIVSHCPLLGIELSYELYKGKYVPNNYATLDKIDPRKGYVEGNVQILSYRANTLKNDATLEELKLIVKNWKA